MSIGIRGWIGGRIRVAQRKGAETPRRKGILVFFRSLRLGVSAPLRQNCPIKNQRGLGSGGRGLHHGCFPSR